MLRSAIFMVFSVCGLAACGGDDERAEPDGEIVRRDGGTPRDGGMAPGGEDGSAGEPDADVMPDAGEWIDPGPPGPEIRFIYMVPSDRVERPEYVRGIERAARHVQRFFLDELAMGITVRLHDPIVEVVRSTRAADTYATSPRSGEPMSSWWGSNTREDGFALTGGGYDDPAYVWIYYNDSQPVCGQTGGTGGNGVAALPENDLRGLSGMTGLPVCPDDPMWWYEFPPCRWVGGLGHELGHALGLPHPPGCDEGAPSCDMDALMWTGVYGYPDTYLRDDDKTVLAASPFLGPRGAATPFDCDAL